MGQAWDAITELMRGVKALGVPAPIGEAIERLIRHHATSGVIVASGTLPVMPVDIGRTARLMHRRGIARADLLGDLLADGAWHMLLELTAEDARGRGVSVSGLCIASGLPQTTALRHIKALEDRALIARLPDRSDGRRTWIHLTETARNWMHQAVREYAGGAAERPRTATIYAVPQATA